MAQQTPAKAKKLQRKHALIGLVAGLALLIAAGVLIASALPYRLGRTPSDVRDGVVLVYS